MNWTPREEISAKTTGVLIVRGRTIELSWKDRLYPSHNQNRTASLGDGDGGGKEHDCDQDEIFFIDLLILLFNSGWLAPI